MVVTRFAPSPTGYLHIGGVRTALFSWLYAKKQQGKFILRIEDTDLERSTKESVEVILAGMAWLGLDYQVEGPYFQSQRFDRYKEVVQQLLEQDLAYYCYATSEEIDQLRAEQEARKEKPRYDGRYRDYKGPPREGVDPVIRFKMPLEGVTVINDLVKGRVAVEHKELDDLVIARSDGTPLYNFCVVVDDHDMGITHVMRGDDHFSNTPKQINIYKALGWDVPQFAHIPLILNQEGAKLSKRDNAANVLDYRDKGYLPQALLNYLVRLGWSYGDQEIFSIEEMINLFAIEDINKSSARFDSNKINWLNEHYLKTLAPKIIVEHLKPQLDKLAIDYQQGAALVDIILALRERSKTLLDMAEAARYFYQEPTSYDEKAEKQLKPETLTVLEHIKTGLENLSDWNKENLHQLVQEIAAKLTLKMPKVAQPLRAALMGSTVSPSIDDTLYLVGKDKSIQRLEKTIAYIKHKSEK